MALFQFRKPAPAPQARRRWRPSCWPFIEDAAHRREGQDFRALPPLGPGSTSPISTAMPIEDMATAKRICDEGFAVMPPSARIKDKATLTDWVSRYKDVGVKQGLCWPAAWRSRWATMPPRCSF